MSLDYINSKKIRKSFGKIPLVTSLPNLVEVQKRSYDNFLQLKVDPDKKEDTCISSIERTRSEFCAIAKKQISLTTISLKEKTSKIIKDYPKEIATSLLTTTKETSLIENIAKKSVIYNRR